MFAKIINNQVVQFPIHDIRAEFPDVSLPLVIGPMDLPEGYLPVVHAQPPNHNGLTHKPVANAPALVDGVWTVTYTIQPLTADEVAAQTPPVVTMRQARQALLQADLLDDVDAAIAAIPDAQQRRLAQIEWEYSTEVRRSSALVAAIAAALNLTDAQLNQLFLQASAL